MKYIVMAALLMAGTASFAQEGVKQTTQQTQLKKTTPAEKAAKLKTSLVLDANQEAKVKELYEEQEKAMTETRDKIKATKDIDEKKALMQDIKANREQFDLKMKRVLTEEQYTKWSAPKNQRFAEGLKAGAMPGKALEQKQTTPATGN